MDALFSPHFKPRTRRAMMRDLSLFMAASPLYAQQRAGGDTPRAGGGTRTTITYPPLYDAEVMRPANVHEFEPIAKGKIHKIAYDYVAGGADDEATMRANIEAYRRVWIRRRVMVDVSKIDTSLELLGQKLVSPILLDPTGGKNIVNPNADVIAAEAAFDSKAVYCINAASGLMNKLQAENRLPVWWSNSVGLGTPDIARGFARRSEDAGAAGFIITVDYQYTPNRDRNNRNHYDHGYNSSEAYVSGPPQPARSPAVPAMLRPSTPSMTWEVVDWLHGASNLPVILKGILRADDAQRAVQAGANAIVVSNHGGRALDGAIATLDALPAVVEAVDGKIPVLIDGGIRRGSDIFKALALGATAVLVGRPYVWGLAAFGKQGVQRVIDMLRAELQITMGLAGVPDLASISPRMIQRAWVPPGSGLGRVSGLVR
jgi:isopentenyl diphosphate isomerase/L-lactate dehydrogenase-like FMN-dependent dehydrogenase